MCLIIASPNGKRISREILEDAERTNSHGGGLAWFDQANKTIQFRKGLELKDVESLFETDVKDQPWVVHFRINTVGGVCDELTHPFTIDKDASVASSGNASSVFFQNGTFNEWKQYLMNASARSGIKIPPLPWSDSRAIAFCLGVYGKHLLSLLDNSSRFLVFDADEDDDNRMMLWGKWEDHDEFKFSNSGNIAFRRRTYDNWQNSHSSNQSRGSGSTNPSQAATAANNGSGTNDASRNSSSSNSSSNSSSSADSPTAETRGTTGSQSTVRSSRNTKGYVPKNGYNAWTSFTETGLEITGDNETSVPLTA